MSNQPQWELVYATDYSALYRDTTGVYPPELAIAQTLDDVDEDDIEATSAYVYRFPLDRMWQRRDDDGTSYLVTIDPMRVGLPCEITSAHAPWFASDLGSIADSVGSTIGALVDALCSDDPATLAEVYEAIGGYHGFDNFDSSPKRLTATEFAQWPDRGPRLST